MSQDYQNYGQQQGGWQDPNQQGQQQGGWQDPNQQGQQQGGWQDPNQQGQQQGGWQDPNQQQQGGWQDPNQQGQQQGGWQDPNQQGQQGQGQGMFGGVNQMANQQIDSAIDQFANKIPGGQQYSQQAKDAASGALDNLEQQGVQEAEKRFGFGGGNQGN
jgi:hypothetical protein